MPSVLSKIHDALPIISQLGKNGKAGAIRMPCQMRDANLFDSEQGSQYKSRDR